MSPTRPRLDLTFGIEVEARLKYISEEPSYIEAEWKDAVREELRKHSLAACVVGYKSADHDKWTIAQDDSINVVDGIPDQSEDDIHTYPLEVVSPVIRFSEEGLAQVGQVLDLLNKEFSLDANHPSCGLHVHVGHDIRGFPLRTISNVAVLTVGFEHLFSRLQPQQRHYSDFCWWNSHSAPLSIFEYGLECVHEILKQQTFTSLINTLQGNPTTKDRRYHLLNLCSMLGVDLVGNQKRTIEFRSHYGTTDPEVICRWVRLLAAIVQYAHQIDDRGLFELVRRIPDPDFGVEELITVVAGDYLATCYAEVVPSNPVPPEHPLYNDELLKEIRTMLDTREATMGTVEQDLVASGLPEAGEVDEANAAGKDLELLWIPWNRIPFSRPWNAKMEKWWKAMLHSVNKESTEEGESVDLLMPSAATLSLEEEKWSIF